MRNILALFVCVFTLLFANQAFAQQAVPDYSNWENQSGQVQAVHDGKQVVLTNTVYKNVDEATNLEELVNILNDENGKPWLIIYKYLQHTSDHQNEKPTQSHLFEYKNGKWVHIQDLSNGTEDDFYNLLKSKYNLEF